MRRIILIAGLPGSGKTYLGKRIAQRLDGILVDDPKSLQELPEDFNVLVITDPSLCFKQNQDRAEEYLYNRYQDCPWIEWIFFENSPVQCLNNSRNRTLQSGHPKRVDGYIIQAARQYHVRPNSILCKVYKPEANP